VSAWRKKSTSPVATAAPAFICVARPGRERTTRAQEEATEGVRSVEPPSATMISFGPESTETLRRVLSMHAASFRAGMTTEIFTRNDWGDVEKGAEGRFYQNMSFFTRT
jgi:hypothetical protein